MARQPLSLKGRALKYLSMREHSRLELARKLSKHAEEGDDIEALLDFLEKNNWLSQERFAEALVHRRAGRFGTSRVLAELQQHGVQGDELAELKSSLASTEVERARDVWRRKFHAPPQDAAERAKQIRFLAQRGFSQSAIRTALKGLDDDDFHS
jgi:regulatory protein